MLRCTEKSFLKSLFFELLTRGMTQWRIIIFSSTMNPHRHNISVTNQKSWQLIWLKNYLTRCTRHYLSMTNNLTNQILKPQTFFEFFAGQPCLPMISWMVVFRLWPGLVSPVGSSSQWPCAVILVSRANLPSQCAESMGECGGEAAQCKWFITDNWTGCLGSGY